MLKYFIKKIIRLRNFLVYKKFSFQAYITQKPFPLDPKAEFVISIASYPQRIHFLPAVVQALTKQTLRPRHLYLILSEEEWHYKQVPNFIEKLVKRGVEILWTKGNPYAVKKLLPVIERHPDLGIITLDDEIIYGQRIVEELINKCITKKCLIVGHVGKVLYRKGNKISMMYRDKKPADLKTPSNQIYFLVGMGTLYLPGSIDHRALDLDAVKRIVPGRGSDIWFWAAAISANSKQICLGTPTTKDYYIPIPQNKKTIPKDQPGVEVMEMRFQRAVDYFGIREKLLLNLPDKEDE